VSTIQVDIVSLVGQVFSGQAEMVFCPAEMGEVGIAPRHAPLITRLKPGEVRVKSADGEQHFFVNGGILEIQPHAVTVLSDVAVRAKDLDEASALEAKRQAEQLLSERKGELDIARAQAALVEASARLHMIQRLKRGGGG
jgi:F-type H+-transporting ATPase subunit epsilon